MGRIHVPSTVHRAFIIRLLLHKKTLMSLKVALALVIFCSKSLSSFPTQQITVPKYLKIGTCVNFSSLTVFSGSAESFSFFIATNITCFLAFSALWYCSLCKFTVCTSARTSAKIHWVHVDFK